MIYKFKQAGVNQAHLSYNQCMAVYCSPARLVLGAATKEKSEVGLDSDLKFFMSSFSVGNLLVFEISVKLSLGKLFRVQPLERPKKSNAGFASREREKISLKISSEQNRSNFRSCGDQKLAASLADSYVGEAYVDILYSHDEEPRYEPLLGAQVSKWCHVNTMINKT